MRLDDVVANVGRIVRGSPSTEITRVEYDSRRAGPGALFCALPGAKADGAQFVADALARGAAAVLAGHVLEGAFPLVVANDPRRAMALIAASSQRFPAAKLTMLGVTGTNGKTTVASLAEEMARAAGRRTGLIGTVEQRFGAVARPATHTTPESVDLQSLLAEMVAASVEIVAMEVSSHALAQQRVAGIRYRAAAFTQLTRDHLDFHGSMEAYFAAKAQLFREHLADAGTAVLPADDAWGAPLVAELGGTAKTVWRTGVDCEGELVARGVSLSLAGFALMLETPHGRRAVTSPLVGLHNVRNALAAAGLALAGGVPLDAVASALRTSRGAPGRLEPVPDAAGRYVFVDYAHTDDALANVLEALRKLAPAGARIVTVFGCGGDRDQGKRPLMGLAAGRVSDVVIVTSDNPRTEEPGAILDMIVPGVEQAGLSRAAVSGLAGGGRGFAVVEDRAEAIAAAVRVAGPGDVVLIAGKGHEDYQLVGAEKRHFDDREVARAALGRAE
jgi:UDP-N-acetylmuramoyl-L-alanyl-D-glutamate--2,6-diaminopimelate ligase